jgi:ribose transport system permease protein
MSQTASKTSRDDHWARRLLPWLFDAGFAPTLIVIIGIFMTFKSDVFLTSRNLQNILLQTSFLAIAAFGMTFIIIASELDLSMGSAIALVGVIAADVMVRNNSVLLGLLAGLAAGAAVGLFNGFVSAVLRVPSFITTLGMLVMARGLAREITSGNTVGGLPEHWSDFWATHILGLRMAIWVAVAVGASFHVVLRYTRFGLRVYAVGGNAEAARRAGINVTRVRLAVFLAGGIAIALAGFTVLGRVNSGQPNAAQLTELFAVAAVVLGGTNLFGGRGSIPRTVAGLILIGLLRNSLNLLRVSSNMQDVWLGLVFMLAMTSHLIRGYVVRWTSRLPNSTSTSAAPETNPILPDPSVPSERSHDPIQKDAL